MHSKKMFGLKDIRMSRNLLYMTSYVHIYIYIYIYILISTKLIFS